MCVGVGQACERPMSSCHCSLSCRPEVTDHWLLTGFSVTHGLILLKRKFPSLQLFNRQLPSLLGPRYLYHPFNSSYFHSQSEITFQMNTHRLHTMIHICRTLNFYLYPLFKTFFMYILSYFLNVQIHCLLKWVALRKPYRYKCFHLRW